MPLLLSRTSLTSDAHVAPVKLASAKKEAASRQEAGAAALAAARQQHAEERATLERAAEEAQAAAAAAATEAGALRERRLQELAQLESRFTALLATKDRTIASLSQQLQDLNAALS